MTTLPGEVHLADVFEGGMRPVVIVSREQLNRGTLFLGVPLTSSRVSERRKYANYVFLAAGVGGVREDSVAVAHLVQPVRAEFLRERWGTLPDTALQRILIAIAWSIGLTE
jgi:mRNA-degrading endonuclease toxin of MazEF toxin-antitoxin module